MSILSDKFEFIYRQYTAGIVNNIINQPITFEFVFYDIFKAWILSKQEHWELLISSIARLQMRPLINIPPPQNYREYI